ncbi:metallophosphoesterase [Phycisphaerales bacterium AB-hyl4]|uniref:Phosphoesterase n=1 Tax=Natronomicrosphaera hydrolytica TaxID=3242702 RepID=A0ABV4U229_9BACT
MKIGVISDTHDRLTTFRRAMSLFQRMQVEAIFHAGDFIAPFAAKLIAPAAVKVPVHVVYGNNDGERKGLKGVLPQLQDGPLKVELAGRRIVMEHFIDWLKPADIAGADVIITGHTHEVVNETKDGKLYLNPGECCGWVNDRCTVALLDLATMQAEIVEIHE